MYSITCSLSGHQRLAYMVVIVQDQIIQGQKYSSCSKAGGCRLAQLLGGFRRNLPIVSWVTPTPGCTAKFNFAGNRYSQLLILRPFGRSSQKLPVEYHYQVEPFFVKFSMSTAKKGCRQGQGPASGERFHSDSTSTKIIGKSHRKNPTFYVFTPWLFLYFVGIEGGRYTDFSRQKKPQKLTQLQRGQNIFTLDCNDHKALYLEIALPWYIE